MKTLNETWIAGSPPNFEKPMNTEERFNKLSDSEDERLSILLEELGEVIQIIGKIKRHGYESFNPFDKEKTTNRSLLEKELGDVEYAVSLMAEEDDIDPKKIGESSSSKGTRIAPYLHHQDSPEFFKG